MLKLSVNLPENVHHRLNQMASESQLEPEELARQVLAVWLGFNSSSKDTPLSTNLLRNQSDAVLQLAETGTVFLRDATQGDFVVLTDSDYSALLRLT